MKDPLGCAVLDFWKDGKAADIIVHSDICEDDLIQTPYLFRCLDEMPALEQKALAMAKGKVLDVGAAAGTHVLELQKKGLEVAALDISLNCTNVMAERGVKRIIHEDFYNYTGDTYDTILILMNGAGIAGNIENLPVFFSKLKSLLSKEGQVLIDTSDLRFLYENEDGSLDIDLNAAYYGEVQFQMEYKGETGAWFNWLYLDKQSFEMYARMFGFDFELVMDGQHYDYLARLKRIR